MSDPFFCALRPTAAAVVIALCAGLCAAEPAADEARPEISTTTVASDGTPIFSAERLYDIELDEAVLPRSLEPGDLSFKAAQEAFRKGRLTELERLGTELRDHPLTDYVTLWTLILRLKKNPDDPAANAAVVDFVEAKDGLYIAERGASDYLELVSSRINQALFNRLYQRLRWNKDEPVLRAWFYYYNFDAEPLDSVKRFLRDTKLTGEALRSLTDKVLAVDPSWAWPATVLLMEKQRWREVRHLIDKLPASSLPGPKKDLQAILNNPERWYRKNRQQLHKKPARLGVFMLLRLVRKNLDSAEAAAEKIIPRLAPEWQSLLRGIIAYEALVALRPDASERFKAAGSRMFRHPLLVSPELMSTYVVRAHLRAKDWSAAAKAIDAMPDDVRTQETWVYWRARAYSEAGKKNEAEKLFLSIADNYSFYGKLAADAIGRPYALARRTPEPPSEAELHVWQSRPGLKRAEAFYRLDQYSFGHREWNWEMRGLQSRGYFVLAAYAKDRRLVHRMINTGQRATGESFSLSQAFPTPQLSLIEKLSADVSLPTAWVLGIIRQESRFMPAANSSVGARGLMQVMPATARWIVKKTGRAPVKRQALSELRPNLELGTTYLRLLQDGFEGSFILATAAYNAGPARARAWRKALTEPMEAAVFIETIPFYETRDYVKNVLSNMKTYSQLLGNDIGNFTDFVGTVTPGDSAGSADLF